MLRSDVGDGKMDEDRAALQMERSADQDHVAKVKGSASEMALSAAH